MQIYTTLITLLLAATALACDQGPYEQGSGCGGTCLNAHRCSKNGQNVVRQRYLSVLTPIPYIHVSCAIHPWLPIPPA